MTQFLGLLLSTPLSPLFPIQPERKRKKELEITQPPLFTGGAELEVSFPSVASSPHQVTNQGSSPGKHSFFLKRHTDTC